MAADGRRILVIKLGALGDFIQALGPMAAIRGHHPNEKITLLTTRPFEKFAKACGYFDEIWLDERPGWFNIRGWLSLRKSLIHAGFRRVYDLQNNDRTSLYYRLFKKGSRPEWVGIAKGASHRNASPERTAGHAFDGHVQTLALAGIVNIQLDTLKWIKASIASFPLKRPYVLLVPGSAPQHPGKRWPAAHYGRLALLLYQTGYQPVIVGAAAEAEAAAAILKHCPAALDLTGHTSLEQVAVLARGAAGAVGNDTGPMHLIAATGCPCLSLFSHYSDPVRHAPRGRQVMILQPKDLQNLKPEKVLRSLRPREDAPQRQATTLH